MIHHVSIPAREPRRVATVLAELMNGRVYPFPGPVVNSFMAVSGDANGTMIEVYPESTVLEPGDTPDEEVRACMTEPPSHWPFHILLSVPLDRSAVEAIGAREGWRAAYLGRGPRNAEPVFHVIEFWLENRLMLEVATPDMVPAYVRTIRFEALDAHGVKQVA